MLDGIGLKGVAQHNSMSNATAFYHFYKMCQRQKNGGCNHLTADCLGVNWCGDTVLSITLKS